MESFILQGHQVSINVNAPKKANPSARRVCSESYGSRFSFSMLRSPGRWGEPSVVPCGPFLFEKRTCCRLNTPSNRQIAWLAHQFYRQRARGIHEDQTFYFYFSQNYLSRVAVRGDSRNFNNNCFVFINFKWIRKRINRRIAYIQKGNRREYYTIKTNVFGISTITSIKTKYN